MDKLCHEFTRLGVGDGEAKKCTEALISAGVEEPFAFFKTEKGFVFGWRVDDRQLIMSVDLPFDWDKFAEHAKKAIAQLRSKDGPVTD